MTQEDKERYSSSETRTIPRKVSFFLLPSICCILLSTKSPRSLKAAFNIYVTALPVRSQVCLSKTGILPQPWAKCWWDRPPDLSTHSQQRSCFSLEFTTTSAYSEPAVSQAETIKQKNHLEGNHDSQASLGSRGRPCEDHDSQASLGSRGRPCEDHES